MSQENFLKEKNVAESDIIFRIGLSEPYRKLPFQTLKNQLTDKLIPKKYFISLWYSNDELRNCL